MNRARSVAAGSAVAVAPARPRSQHDSISAAQPGIADGHWPILAALVVGYGAIAVPIAALKPLWNDEIYSFTVARQPAVGSIWRALQNGADNLPPLDYWLRHWSMAMFGTSELAFRVPSIIAVSGAAVLLFRLFARHLGVAAGWAAAVLMLITSGYAQSVEARGYALLLFFFALALDAWDRLAVDPAPARSAAILSIALVGGMYSHYYGSLYFLVFVAAAASEMWHRRTLWAPPVVAVGVAGVACLPLVALIRTASRFSTNFWSPVTLTAALTFYRDLLSAAIPCLVAMGVVLALLAAKGVRAPAQSAALPMATTAALAAAVALPIPLFVMARLWTGAFHPKFVPAAGVSICLLAVALVAGVPMGRRWRQTVLIGLPSFFLSVQAARQGQSLLHQGSHAEFASALATLQATVPEPIVIADDALFVELMHYDRQGKLTKCYFVHDALPAERSNVDKAIVGLAALTPLRVVSFDKWIRDHSRFAYIGDETYPLIRRAVADGAGLTLHRASNVNVNYWLVDYRR